MVERNVRRLTAFISKALWHLKYEPNLAPLRTGYRVRTSDKFKDDAQNPNGQF